MSKPAHVEEKPAIDFFGTHLDDHSGIPIEKQDEFRQIEHYEPNNSFGDNDL